MTEFKPNIAFLRKVRDRNVYRWGDYTKHSGLQYKFVGGEKTAQRHEKAGYITGPSYPGVMRRSTAALTEKGIAALQAAEADASPAS